VTCVVVTGDTGQVTSQSRLRGVKSDGDKDLRVGPVPTSDKDETVKGPPRAESTSDVAGELDDAQACPTHLAAPEDTPAPSRECWASSVPCPSRSWGVTASPAPHKPRCARGTLRARGHWRRAQALGQCLPAGEEAGQGCKSLPDSTLCQPPLLTSAAVRE